MKKHNARKKKVANRVKAHNSKSSNARIGQPLSGGQGISNAQFTANENAVLSAVNGFKTGTGGRFYVNPEKGAVDFRELEDDERICIAHGIAKSRLLRPGEEPEGSATFGAFRKHTEDPYWNIGCFGSIWLDLKSDAGNDYRVSLISDEVGSLAFAVFPQLETEEQFMEMFGHAPKLEIW